MDRNIHHRLRDVKLDSPISAVNVDKINSSCIVSAIYGAEIMNKRQEFCHKYSLVKVKFKEIIAIQIPEGKTSIELRVDEIDLKS